MTIQNPEAVPIRLSTLGEFMLTTQQKATLKAAILAAGGGITAAYNAGASSQVADLCNAPSATAVWRTDAPVDAILDAIDFSRYTPNDAADSTVTYTNRALLAQTKQMNLQLMLQGRAALDCSRATIRASLRDAVIAVPTGTGGVATSPGGASGANVLAACTRFATFAEAALKGNNTTTGTTTAALLVFEGQISVQDIDSL